MPMQHGTNRHRSVNRQQHHRLSETQVKESDAAGLTINFKEVSQEETCLFLTEVLGAPANRVTLPVRSFLFGCYKPAQLCF